MGAASPAEVGARLRSLLHGLARRGEQAAGGAVFDWLGILWRRLFPHADPAILAAWRRDFLNEETAMSTFVERVR